MALANYNPCLGIIFCIPYESLKMKNFNIKENEIEFKYYANNISVEDFNNFSRKLNPEKYVEVYSWDHYYKSTNPDAKIEFLRFRNSTKPELTFKIKREEKNNNQRIEVDLPLDPNMNSQELKEYVDLFTKHLGFEWNFSLFKYCHIYYYNKIDTTYYITYDEEMKEKGRFCEVEARKDCNFENKEEAEKLVLDFEQKLSAFGITPQNRMRKSQWELNKR
jgi:CYTH domain